MSEFKQYQRKQKAELREVTQHDIDVFTSQGAIVSGTKSPKEVLTVSISDADLSNGSPKLGDMIARNPVNHIDQWLVAHDYFKDNFEEIPSLLKDDTV